MLNQKERVEQRYLIPKGKIVYLDGNDRQHWATQSPVCCRKQDKYQGMYSVVPTNSFEVVNTATKRERVVRAGERVRVPYRSLVKA